MDRVVAVSCEGKGREGARIPLGWVSRRGRGAETRRRRSQCCSDDGHAHRMIPTGAWTSRVSGEGSVCIILLEIKFVTLYT